MRPNDDTPATGTPQRGAIQPPQREHAPQHQAVAQMTRQQISQIYTKQAEAEQQPEPAEQPTESANTYHRTHTAQHTTPDQWQHYHSSWQDYYQKYYERYYVGAVQQAHASLQEHLAATQAQTAASQPAVTTPAEPETLSQKEAVEDLRSELLGKVQSHAQKIRKSRHFVPIMAAMAVMLIFVFLQYNTTIIGYAKSYVSPGNIDPQNIIVDPNASLKVSKAPRLIIPKLNIDVGVDYDAKPDHKSQIEAMRKNVAYFGIPGANSKPGQNGNTAIAGHSSNEWYTTGDQELKFVFVRLHDLKKGDTFYLNYKGTRYTYSVTKHLVVKPKDIGALRLGNDKPYATLITCTPIGSAEKRLLVVAEQISPAPGQASKAPTSSGSEPAEVEMTGKEPTLIERLFGAE